MYSSLRNVLMQRASQPASLSQALKFQPLLASQSISVRMFAREIKGDNTPLIDKDLMKRELELFEKLPAEEQKKRQLERDAMLKVQKLIIDDENNWQNKLIHMSQADIKLLPTTFIKKYNSYLSSLNRHQMNAKLSENRSAYGGSYYDQIKNLKELQTKEQRDGLNEHIQFAKTDSDHVDVKDLVREKGDYFKRQPRVDLDSYGYNHEQFKRYTKEFKHAKEADDRKSREFYKLVRYVKENKDQTEDPFVKKFSEVDQFDADLIDVPEEFADLELEDLEHVNAKKLGGRKVIRNRTSRSLEGYDAWRCTDRTVLKADGKHRGQRTLMLSPASLVRCFGWPETSQVLLHGSGQYDFEDSSLDAYSIFDYKQTTLYHGLNREDEYYDTPKNMRKPPQARKRKWPDLEEFWTSEEPKPFRFVADDKAEWRKFVRWLRKEIEHREKIGGSYEQDALDKFGHEFDISHGEWDVKGKVNHDNIAVLQYDWTHHLTKAELKAVKKEDLPEPFESPKMPDLSAVERIFVDKDEIKQEMEEEKVSRDSI